MTAALFSAVAFLASGLGYADDTEQAEARLDALLAEYRAYSLAEDPVAATLAGVASGNDRLPGVAPEDLERRLLAERRFLARVRDLDRKSLSDNGRLNAELFEWVLNDSLGSYDLELDRIPFNTFSGFYMTALTASNGVRMEKVADYEDYLARLSDIPRYFDENLANMARGAAGGFVLPQIVIDGVLPTIRAQVKDDPEASSFYAPFQNMTARVPAPEQDRLREEARSVIAGAVMPAFDRLANYLAGDYAASPFIAAEALPDGKAFYAFQIRRYTTIPGLGAREIHRIGLEEVKRIRAEMEAIIDEVDFPGDFQAFTEYLRTDPRFYATSADDLLKEAAWVAKRIDHRLPGFFGHLPRQPYGIVPVPDEIAPNYTTGAYHGAPQGGDHGGEYWLNTYALDQRPLYELPALTLHEAVPGHHLQQAIALEMEAEPEFRNDLYFSAFGEGWALYAERLGVEMGIYRTPYENFGRLSYEMWRACRLVVDTGIHSQGWTRDAALAYMADNTSLSEANIRAEVDRYISWPGQALAYKLGELDIWRMRADAESLLGERFDLREFHDVLLENGALPLAMLRAVVERYIDRELSGE